MKKYQEYGNKILGYLRNLKDKRPAGEDAEIEDFDMEKVDKVRINLYQGD